MLEQGGTGGEDGYEAGDDKHRASRREEVPATWRGIMISDQALGNDIPLSAPFLGEGVGEVSDAAKEVLQLPPKTAVYSKITLKDIEREVLKAVNVKARWEDLGRQEREEQQQTREEADEEERVDSFAVSVFEDNLVELTNTETAAATPPTVMQIFQPASDQ